MAKDSYYTSGAGLVPARTNPFVNDMLQSKEFGEKTRLVRGKKGWATKAATLFDPETGEVISDQLCLATKQEVDNAQFVKIFVAGLHATFGLSKRGRDAFTALLRMMMDNRYKREDTNDRVMFDIHDAEKYGWRVQRGTFRSAMNELCHNKFLCPVEGASDWYWTNPTFFHRGDRLVIVSHYINRDAEKMAADSARPAGDPDLDQMDFDGMTERERRAKGD